MNKGIKILLTILFAVGTTGISAQIESPLLPFFNPLIVNPALAGMEKTSNFRTGNQYSFVDSASSYNLFYATYDCFSDKLNGGIAFYFQQGLIGSRNITTTEFGFAYAGFQKKTKNGTIKFGLNANYLLATKQWLIAVTDKFTADGRDLPNVPGTELVRYSLVKPRVSFLWELPDMAWGASLGSSLKIDFGEEEDPNSQIPFFATLYITKNFDGYKNGLHSLPFSLHPELVLFYNDSYFLGRLNLYSEFKKNTLGLFLNGDFFNSEYSFGGIGGFASNNFRLNMAVGSSYSIITQKLGFKGELSLILKVPQIDYSKINPWEPQ